MNSKKVQRIESIYISKKATKDDNALFNLLSLYSIIGILRSTNLNFYSWESISQILQLLCLLFSTFFILRKAYNNKLKMNLFAAILLFCGIMEVFTSKHTFMLGFSIFYIGLSTYDFKKMINRFTKVLVCTFIFIEFLVFVHIIPMGYASRETLTRLCFGFKTSTLPLSLLFFILLGYLYVKRERANVLVLLIGLALALLLHHYTDSRTGFYGSVFLIFLALIDKTRIFKKIFRWIKKHGFLRTVAELMPILIFIFDCVLIYIYSFMSPLSFMLNSMLSTRLSLTYDIILNYRIMLFGQYIPSTVNGVYSQTDICYFFYLMNYGLATLLLTIIMEITCIYKSFKTNDRWLLIVMILILFDGIVEPYLLDYKYQLFTLASASLLMPQKHKIYKLIKV